MLLGEFQQFSRRFGLELAELDILHGRKTLWTKMWGEGVVVGAKDYRRTDRMRGDGQIA